LHVSHSRINKLPYLLPVNYSKAEKAVKIVT